MRAGRLDRLVTIRRRTVTPSDSGEPTEAWADLGVTRRPAGYAPVRGEERFSDPQLGARQQVNFWIRYSSEVADLSPLDHIVYPARSGNSPADEPDEKDIYDILAVDEVGRREGFKITAVRRPDVTP